ncbi:hypothetical protein D3C87_1112650 [compost metagenome]
MFIGCLGQACAGAVIGKAGLFVGCATADRVTGEGQVVVVFDCMFARCGSGFDLHKTGLVGKAFGALPRGGPCQAS